MRTVAGVGAWLVIAAGVSSAQSGPETEVLAAVHRLLDGMRAGDSTLVRSVLDPEARLVSTDTRGGPPTVRVQTADDFVTAVGGPRDAVWTRYAFFPGDRFSQCGVDAWHLVRRADGWKIVDLAYTRQREGCTMPPKH